MNQVGRSVLGLALAVLAAGCVADGPRCESGAIAPISTGDLLGPADGVVVQRGQITEVRLAWRGGFDFEPETVEVRVVAGGRVEVDRVLHRADRDDPRCHVQFDVGASRATEILDVCGRIDLGLPDPNDYPADFPDNHLVLRLSDGRCVAVEALYVQAADDPARALVVRWLQDIYEGVMRER